MTKSSVKLIRKQQYIAVSAVSLAAVFLLGLSVFPSHQNGEDSFVKLEPFLSSQTMMSDKISQANQQPLMSSEHRIALVIDDVGYNLKALKRLIQLPYPVAISILPFTPNARKASKLAHESDLVVMLHMPMESEHAEFRSSEFIGSDMTQREVWNLLEKALKQVPHAVGMNNHMGSRATKDARLMQWVMEFCDEKGLFFIDSRTIATTVAADIAKENHLPWNERTIFLDHDQKNRGMELSWKQALQAGLSSPQLVIAHPHKRTLRFLEGLQLQNVSIVPITSILHEVDRS